MALNTQFSIAVHILAGLGCCADQELTSSRLAASVNTSPSFVRRVLAKLSRAGLIETCKGKKGACWLARSPRDISLLQVYRAVEAPAAFAIHSYAERKPCRVSCHIKSALERVLAKTQKAMEASLKKITLAQVIADLQRK
jgi:Rrf2 family protein